MHPAPSAFRAFRTKPARRLTRRASLRARFLLSPLSSVALCPRPEPASMTATPNQKLVHGSLWPEWAPLEAFKVAVFKFARAPSASLVFFRLISLTLLASDLRATFEQGFNPAIDEVRLQAQRATDIHRDLRKLLRLSVRDRPRA